MEKYKIGDKINVGKEYTATCQKIDKDGVIFCMDQYLSETYPMNKTNTAKGGYENSYLREVLKDYHKNPIFEYYYKNDLMVPFKNGDYVRIPYVEELFGSDDDPWYEPSKNKQWVLMKYPENRKAKVKYKPWYGWLANVVSATDFANVNGNGNASCNSASLVGGVRLVFKLR